MELKQGELFQSAGPGNYYNTTSQPQEIVKKKRLQNGEKNREVLKIFSDNPQCTFSPCDIWSILQRVGPLTSVRRAISDLTKDEYLVKLQSTKIGIYGDAVHLWRFKGKEIK